MRIIAVAGDVGSARCIEPVVQALGRLPGVEVDCRPYKHAIERWRDAGLGVRPLSEGSVGPFTHALVATSVGDDKPWELEIIDRARASGARSVAVLDHWTNYRERFLIGERLVLPDAIAVMDGRARDEMIIEGFPADRLVVTGHPSLENITPATPERRKSGRHRLELSLGVGGGRRVLWASQPFACGTTPERVGFDPDDAFRRFAHALADHADATDMSIQLLFRPHPRDGNHQAPKFPHSPRLQIHRVPVEYPAKELVVGVDLVAGMQSMLLLEAALLGVPTISYQPGLRLPDPLPSHYSSWSYAIYDDEALFRALPIALAATPARALQRPNTEHHGATERIIRLLVQPT